MIQASGAHSVRVEARRAETQASPRLGLRQPFRVGARAKNALWGTAANGLAEWRNPMGMTDDDDTVYCDVQMPLAQGRELLQLVSTLRES